MLDQKSNHVLAEDKKCIAAKGSQNKGDKKEMIGKVVVYEDMEG